MNLFHLFLIRLQFHLLLLFFVIWHIVTSLISLLQNEQTFLVYRFLVITVEMITVEIGPFGWEVVKIGNAAHRAIRMHLIIYGALGLAVSHLDVRNWAQVVKRGLTALISTVAFHYLDWLGVPFETHRWRSARIRACFLINKWILLNIESSFSRFVFTLDNRKRHKPHLQSCIILLFSWVPERYVFTLRWSKDFRIFPSVKSFCCRDFINLLLF